MADLLAALVLAVLAQTEQASTCPCRVVREATPIGQVELAAVLRDSHHEVFGRFPSARRLRTAWAHVAFENGQGSESWCHNLGMVGADRGRAHFLVGGSRLAALPSFRDGAALYWRTVRRLCSGALAFFDAGDGYGAGLALGRCGYHRTEPEAYARAVRDLGGAAGAAVEAL